MDIRYGIYNYLYNLTDKEVLSIKQTYVCFMDGVSKSFTFFIAN